jgi:ABC-type phosphate/phosphonate transport system substrate-binding protein
MPTCPPPRATSCAGLPGAEPVHAEGKEILELQRATRFVPTKADNYKGIEAAARSAGLL